MPKKRFKFGTIISPFGRCQKPLPPYKKLYDYHKNRDNFSGFIHNAKNDGAPKHPKKLKVIPEKTLSGVRNRTSPKNKKLYCYLWVINKEKVIEILWEGQKNLQDIIKKEVKHTNITGGQKAFHGGEMFFGSNNKIYLNNASDRYGDSGEYWQTVVDFFKEVYNKYEIIDIN